MLFSTLIYPHVFKKVNINRKYRAFGNVGLNTYANSTFAKRRFQKVLVCSVVNLTFVASGQVEPSIRLYGRQFENL